VEVELFVHPRTSILLRNRHLISWNRRKRHVRQIKQVHENLDRRIMGESRKLRRTDGRWYEVMLSQLPMPCAQANDTVYDACWDTVRKK
jgi:hypothetical protein